MSFNEQPSVAPPVPEAPRPSPETGMSPTASPRARRRRSSKPKPVAEDQKVTSRRTRSASRRVPLSDPQTSPVHQHEHTNNDHAQSQSPGTQENDAVPGRKSSFWDRLLWFFVQLYLYSYYIGFLIVAASVFMILETEHGRNARRTEMQNLTTNQTTNASLGIGKAQNH